MAKILIIDDEKDICDLLKEVISDWGHEVIVANNGQEGLVIMKKENPLVVLLDYRMPKMNGDEVLKQIDSENIQSHAIIMTASVSDEKHSELKLLGAVGVITKPFEILKLKNELAEILPLIFRD